MAKVRTKDFRKLVTGGDPDQLYPVPHPEEFAKANTEYLEAPEIETIAEKIMEAHGGFGYLADM
jgi:hypothetical protein